MIIILARYLPWKYLYERGWAWLPATYVFPIGNVENQWSFCWLGGVKVVEGDKSDGRILPAFETWEVFPKSEKSQVLP